MTSGVQQSPVFTSREQPAESNPFHEFVQRYRYDPVGFVRNVLGVEPDEQQQEILEDVFVRGQRQISVRSGHGTGKSTTFAWVAVIAMCVLEQAKVVQTAPSGPQLFDALFAETKSWFNRLPDALRDVFIVKTDRIEHKAMPEDLFISARTSRAEAPEAMQGVHAERGMVILMPDESSGIPEAVFEAASGSMSGRNCVTMLAGNPTRTSGFFFDTHHKLRDIWKTYHWSCIGHPRVAPEYIEEQKRRFGEDSNAYRVRVLGEFPKRDDDVLIGLENCVAAQRREIIMPDDQSEVWGLDVARFGRDSTALAKRRGKVQVEKTKSWKGLDTMETVGRLKNEYDEAQKKPDAINVDVIGIGAGVVDRALEMGLPVFGVNVAEAPAIKGKHINLRAELWCCVRDWVDALDCSLDPNDDTLVGELTMPRYKFNSTGKLQIESKEDMAKRGVPSPNHADAWVLTFANDAVAASGQSGSASGYAPRKVKGAIKRNIKGVV